MFPVTDSDLREKRVNSLPFKSQTAPPELMLSNGYRRNKRKNSKVCKTRYHDRLASERFFLFRLSRPHSHATVLSGDVTKNSVWNRRGMCPSPVPMLPHPVQTGRLAQSRENRLSDASLFLTFIQHPQVLSGSKQKRITHTSSVNPRDWPSAGRLCVRAVGPKQSSASEQKGWQLESGGDSQHVGGKKRISEGRGQRGLGYDCSSTKTLRINQNENKIGDIIRLLCLQ